MKTSFFTFFLFISFTMQTLFADTTCDDFESIILNSDLSTTNPIIVNDDYLELNLIGLQLYMNEGENFYRISKIDYNHPHISEKISEDDIIYAINGEEANFEHFIEIYDLMSRSGLIMDYAYSLDLKYLLLSGLIDDYKNEEFIRDIKNESERYDLPKLLKNYDELNFVLNIQTGSRIDDESDEYIIKEDLIEINTADTYLVPTILTNLDIYNVNDIDGKTQSFKAGYAVEFAYHDRYNLIKSAEEIFGRSSEWSYAWCEWTNHDDADIWGEIEQLWKPDVDFINRLDFDKDKTVEKISMYYYWADENDPPALFIKYEIRGSAQFSTQFKYETFPFDKQYISIDISNHDGTGLGNIYSVNELAFYTSLFQVELDKAVYKDPREVFSNQSLTSGWRLHEKSTYNENFMIWEAEEIKNSTITTVFGIEQLIERNTKYFIYKIFSPIILILMICWSVFWSPPKELESRLTVTITCFLALVAYTFVIDDDLPQLPYLTLMDQLILISYFFASLPTLFAIISHRISLRDNNLSVTFDKYSKIAGIVGYPLVCYIVISIVAGANLYNTTETLKAITFN